MAATRLSSTSPTLAVPADLPTVPWARVESFVGQLTHDVRNGLNALELQLTFLGEISTDPEAVDEVKRLRATLGKVTKQLQTLRESLVITTPYPLDYPAGEFFDDLHERFTKGSPGSNDRALWEIDLDPAVALSVDPELTLSALLELLANALHFAEPGSPPIRVSASATDDRVIFLLQEPRPGPPVVPSEDWGRTPLLTTRRGAYGLGLFRVRRCLEAQGATLEVEHSSARNLLSTQVTLPRVPVPQP